MELPILGEMMSLNVCAIIVTHDRPAYLGRLLDALSKQTKPPNFIIIVDDLDSPNVKGVIESKVRQNEYKYIRMKYNYGLMGGLYIGIKEAYKLGYDAVWLLDDDCIPEERALEKLTNVATMIPSDNFVIYPANLDYEGVNFTEPVCLKIGERWIMFEQLKEELKGKLYETNGGPNIGVFIMRRVIQSAGFPRPDMFFCGECEYISRILSSGCKVYRYLDAIVYHKRHRFVRAPLIQLYVSIVPIWHDYYEVRNYVFVVKNKGFRALLGHLPSLFLSVTIKIIYNTNRLRRLKTLIRAIFDGLMGRLGKNEDLERIYRRRAL